MNARAMHRVLMCMYRCEKKIDTKNYYVTLDSTLFPKDRGLSQQHTAIMALLAELCL